LKHVTKEELTQKLTLLKSVQTNAQNYL
jgi:hypothetical protein